MHHVRLMTQAQLTACHEVDLLMAKVLAAVLPSDGQLHDMTDSCTL